MARQADGAALEAVKPTDVQSFQREGTQLRRATEADARMKGALEQAKRSMNEQRARLDQNLAAKEAEVSACKEAAVEALVETTTLSREEREQTLVSLWPEIEDAAAAVQDVNAKRLQLQQQAAEQREAEQTQLEINRCLLRMYDGATGVCWDADAADGSRGYVAIDSVKSFDVDGLSKAEAADKIWDTIEACLGAEFSDDDLEELLSKPRGRPARGGA
eukprot:TRINITY_DN13113_c0_g2_i1.p1 TRINITY_DN13113_c0_g2~~TRINITY_DN13113_c0_g2_i1.p1  ORF type:complete len:218 (+),score=90.62 TRINITY_DN13113_c0_g2_i1:91-744(+)